MKTIPLILRELLALSVTIFLAITAVSNGAHAQQSSALDAVKSRGSLRCSAHNGSFPGFFEVDANGNWKGFDIDFCKALATAILGSPEKVTYVPLSWAQRFPSLQSGDVDVLFKATGWTLSRDATQGIEFSIPYFFGGYQFLVHASAGVKDVKGLNGATVCTAAGTSLEPILADFMASHDVKFKVVTFQKEEEERSAYFSGRCDVMASWGPSLAVMRATQADKISSDVILPITLSLEPIAGAIKKDDKKFMLVVDWTIAAMIHAEEMGINSGNVDAFLTKVKADPGANPAAAKLLGVSGDYGGMLGIPKDWAYKVIKFVGNYGEVYERNLGKDSPYKLDRGLNKLWNSGGIIWAPVMD